MESPQTPADISSEKGRKTSLSSFSIDSILTSKKPELTDEKRVSSTSEYPKDVCNRTSAALDLTNNSSEAIQSCTTTSNCYYSANIPAVNVPFSEYYLERLNRLRNSMGALRFPCSYMGVTEETKRFFQTRYSGLPHCFQNFYPSGFETTKSTRKVPTVDILRQVDDNEEAVQETTDDAEISDADLIDADDSGIMLNHESNVNRKKIATASDTIYEDFEDDADNGEGETSSDDDEGKEHTSNVSKTVNERLHGCATDSCIWKTESTQEGTRTQFNKNTKPKIGKNLLTVHTFLDSCTENTMYNNIIKDQV